MQRIIRFSCIGIFVWTEWLAVPAVAHVMTYSGSIVQFGLPVGNGFVTAGTFKPTFDPYQYSCVYGSDAFCNMDRTQYSQAVSDGNFIPIGSGTTTSTNGVFSGSGINLQGTGQQVWLFGFNHANPDLANDLVLASNSSWITSNSPLVINGADATLFVFGSDAGVSIALNGALPFPEPSAALLAGIGALVMMMRMRPKSPTDSRIRSQPV